MSLSALNPSSRQHSSGAAPTAAVIAGPRHGQETLTARVSKTRPPVIVLGGSANALSIARSLGRQGIKVYLSASEGRHVQYSRYCTKAFPYARHVIASDFWQDLLLGPRSEWLHGSVIFTCNDEAVGFLARRRSELETRYRLDESSPDVQLAMLDKQKTLTLAKAAGIPAPRFWQLQDAAQLAAIEGEFSYPLIVKPLVSHLFQAKFAGRKHLTAGDAAEVRSAVERIHAAGLEAMICEMIPGPDHLLASYYTYIDGNGRPLFHFTKRIIRRYRKNEGLACYQITDWDGEIAEIGLRFLTRIGFRGLGNVEFKRDLRDGQLKLIECNPRFTAAQELLVRCGFDIASLIYDHLTGCPVEPPSAYKHGVRLWNPVRDFQAYWQLRAMHELTFAAWLKSVCHRQVFPFFHPADPLPSIVGAMASFRRRLGSTVWASRHVTQRTH